jgi:hypothetical protein
MIELGYREWCETVLQLEGVTGMSGIEQGRPVVMVESENYRRFVRSIVGPDVPVVVTGVLWSESPVPCTGSSPALVPLWRGR